MHEKLVEIRWRDMDAFSHVNNAVFLTYLEEARDEWLTRLSDAVGQTIEYLLARLEIDYRRELTQSDSEVIVRCRLGSLGKSSIETREEISTTDGRVVAEAGAVLVVRDPKTGGSRPLSEAEKRSLQGEI
jgi:acyl-CoA thioester hydrolase